MGEDSKVVPMRPLRDVLREFEALIDDEAGDAPKDGPCKRCNGTGTELIYNERGQVSGGKKCSH